MSHPPSRNSSVPPRLRAPSSLRSPPSPRYSTAPSISLVFAHGSSDTPRPPPSINPSRSGSASEEALSRQLDGSSGGRHMGLRSRRSSTATTATMATGTNGADLACRQESGSVLSEEPEDVGDRVSSPIGGPSSLPMSSEGGKRQAEDEAVSEVAGGGRETIKRKLNGKASSTWLKWTASAPKLAPKVLPAGTSKGKKRAADVDEDRATAGETTTEPPAPAVNAPPRPASDSTTQGIPPINQSPHRTEPMAVPKPADLKPPPSTRSSSPLKDTTQAQRDEISRGRCPSTVSKDETSTWWRTLSKGKKSLAAYRGSPSTSVPPGERGEVDKVEGAQPPPLDPPARAPLNENENETAPIATSKTPSPPQSTVEPEPEPEQPIPKPTTSASPSKSQPAPPASPEEAATPTNSAPPSMSARGWKDYLSWSKANAPGGGEEKTSGAKSAGDRSSSDGVGLEPPSDERPSEHESTPKAAQPPSTWSSYLYALVAEQKRNSSSSETSRPVEPTAVDEDQTPIPAQPTDVRKPPSEPSSTPFATPSSHTEPASPTSSPLRPSTHAPGSRRPSAAGWLNYLAFRASQKKVEAGSVDTGTEESSVMDFSTDPNFPSDPPPNPNQLAPPSARDTSRGRDQGREGRGGAVSITPKASQNLEVARKRLSSASSITNGGASSMSASPNAKSAQSSPNKATKNGSALPHPLPPAVQPNLVIPSFTTTFDRPPRSFLPLPPTSPPSSPPAKEEHKGLAAATTGYAWKALGAVGNYMYGEAPPKATSESIKEDAAEVRGRAEGRHVGGDLPRRVGLGVGGPDDGWKDVRRVVVVGVHGWFPAKMLNSVIGEPTGTSVKFANMMGQAVKQFFDEKGVEDLRLTLMPLEGEGTIDSRVDKLYKAYLSNPAWINDLRRADAIFFAAHSQGCIVTTHLISRMIAQGHIRTSHNAEAVSRCEWAFGPIGVVPPGSPHRRHSYEHSTLSGADGGKQKVAMLSMCGVHLGPLYSISTSSVIQPYLQWFENAAARELFEFQDTTSPVSLAYQRALAMVLENEVRVVLLASLNDQVVPIYGASFSTATHPLLLRALYVDGASYTQSDFMTNLLCFAFMLRNAGIDDERLVEHLSEATAGGLTGLGHSTPYEELSSFTLAVHYLFYATPARKPLPPLQIEPFNARDARNDFELPWIMRALVDAPVVKDLFPGELKDLKEGIVHWKPVTRSLKEIKRRLEPMAGRQSRLRPLPTSPSSASLVSQGTAADNNTGTSPATSKHLAAGLRRDW
ncbi:hypothetical protein IAR50_004334 [Cryptococcus sp. DSM 104548]